MAESSESQDGIFEAVAVKMCRHCSEEISLTAKVCHHCSRVQTGFLRFSNVLRIGEGMSSVVSVGLLTVAFLNFSSTREQLTQANQAISKAEEALKRTSATESQILAARRDVLEVAQTITEIAEILSQSGEAYGGGLGKENQARLRQRLDLLRKKLGQSGLR